MLCMCLSFNFKYSCDRRVCKAQISLLFNFFVTRYRSSEVRFYPRIHSLAVMKLYSLVHFIVIACAFILMAYSMLYALPLWLLFLCVCFSLHSTSTLTWRISSLAAIVRSINRTRMTFRRSDMHHLGTLVWLNAVYLCRNNGNGTTGRLETLVVAAVAVDNSWVGTRNKVILSSTLFIVCVCVCVWAKKCHMQWIMLEK